MKELDHRVSAANIRTLGALVDDATARVRLTMLLIAVAGAAALLLGVIGVSSVVSYAAAGRVREFGIRIALGAAPGHVGSMVLGDGLTVVAIGLTTGLIVALVLMKFLRSLLYEVAPTSVGAFAGRRCCCWRSRWSRHCCRRGERPGRNQRSCCAESSSARNEF